MPVVERPRVEPTDDWQQLQLLAPFPEQHVYELLRPVVLFGRPPAQRADETGTPERTIYRRAVRFDAEGMASLFPPPQVEKHQRLPAKIRAAIRERKAEYPAFRAHEIAFPLDDAQWLKAFRTTPYAPRRQYGGGTTQLPLLSAEHLAALSLRPLGQ